MYDVIVVGAGPAGCTAAKTLAQSGYKVLLAEKFKLPRYKSCSGQLIKKSVDLVKEYFGEDVPDSVMCMPTENKGMILTDDKGKAYRFDQSGLNIWRSSFDNWLTDIAARHGAEIRDGTSAYSCRESNGLVEVSLNGEENYTETAKFVIDCEGVVGTIKRRLLDITPQYITTFQTYNQGSVDLDYHYFYAYLQPELSEYDAWLNVKDNMLVIGVSVKDNSRIGVYYERFLSYMKEHHNLRIKKRIKRDKWLMPHIQPGCKTDHGVGRVLFAGEAAGFLNPMGEGISAGMESGYSAAMSVMNNFDSLEMVYSEYKERTQNLHSYMIRQWNFIAELADTFGDMKSL